MALTGKKRAFADAVLAGFSNKEAAIRAGYSAATASAAGSRLVKDKDVAEHIAQHKKSGKDPAPAAAPAPAAESPPARPSFDLSTVLLHTDPRQFLIAAMNDGALDERLRIDAAKALMPFTHAKLGEGGKKDQKQDAAHKAASKFGRATPPKLVANGGKKV